ncbi:MAG TPA: hypothetical protein VFZ34_19470 [Blastocatellia bacterium]|nr:hypothetical protein [Blastocatellia bacterium]
MENVNPNPISVLLPEAPAATSPDAALAQLLHDCRNQLGGLKLYVTFLKKGLMNNTLNRREGIEICDKILQQIDSLTARTKEVARTSDQSS